MTTTIAIVDDDADIRTSMKMLFDVSGWIGTAYASGYAFLADLLVSEHPDCAVVDLHMPEMSGTELIVRIAAKDIQLPVILLTGDPDDPLVSDAISAGVKTVLRKPTDPDQLLRCISSAITSGHLE